MIGKKHLTSLASLSILAVLSALMFAVPVASLTDTTRPMILSVSPLNNEKSLATNEEITVFFNEEINPLTINKETFKVEQRTTPKPGSDADQYRSLQIDGVITYNGRQATFSPSGKLAPNQVYGNVFTVTVTNGVKDIAGNSLSQDYIWSFTTGGDVFNTGATTSQQNQVQTLVVPVTPLTSTVQTPTAPVSVNTPVTLSNWVWIFGAVILILISIVFLVYFGLGKPEKEKNKKVIQQPLVKTSKSNPFGDIHPVMDLEGIGPKYNKGLLSMGIINTKQLWEGNAAKMAQGTGASLSQVKSWQNMAELSSVKGIGPQYAELIERSGVHSIKQLKNTSPDKLLKLVTKKQESLKINIQGNHPGHRMVNNWIEEAQTHKFSESKGLEI